MNAIVANAAPKSTCLTCDITRTRKGREVTNRLTCSYCPVVDQLVLIEGEKTVNPRTGRAPKPHLSTYRLEEIVAGSDRAFRLTPVSGGTDPEAECYDVLVAEDGTRCDCRHACTERGGQCKHVVSILALLEAGAFGDHPMAGYTIPEGFPPF